MSAKVNEHVDLIRTNPLRLFLDGDIRECMVVHYAAQALSKCICTIVKRIRADIVLLCQPTQKSLIEERRG